ncbi:hypothetical protein Q5M85_05450 [Paraclostridium bifermentans]|nr:hypothetical protein [Paraclostridium bifermentans]
MDRIYCRKNLMKIKSEILNYIDILIDGQFDEERKKFIYKIKRFFQSREL